LECLRSGGLLDRRPLEGLPRDAERDEQGRREQTECRVAYEAAREAAARNLARKAGPLGRLTHRPEDFYAQLDQERLRVCRACNETIYPTAERASDSRRRPTCHYCASSERIVAYHDGGSRARGALGR
jgi:hypothetical protein